MGVSAPNPRIVQGSTVVKKNFWSSLQKTTQNKPTTPPNSVKKEVVYVKKLMLTISDLQKKKKIQAVSCGRHPWNMLLSDLRWPRWELTLGLSIYLPTSCLLLAPSQWRSLWKVSCIQPSSCSVFQILFCHVGLLFHRSSNSPHDFWCLLPTEAASRLGFCSLFWISNLTKFVPVWDSEIQRSNRLRLLGYCGGDPGDWTHKLKSQWEVWIVMWGNWWVLGHMAHLYIEGHQKGQRKQRSENGWCWELDPEQGLLSLRPCFGTGWTRPS